MPTDLTENALEIRVLAGIAVGELLANHTDTTPAILASLALRSALTSRPTATEKYLKWMLEFLLSAADVVIAAQAKARRQRGTPKLEELAGLEEPAEGEGGWDLLRSSVHEALSEAKDQERINREEMEILWWMFAAHSEVAKKPLADIESPVVAAFCCGLELAQRAILPPPPSAINMIKRAVETDREPATLIAVSLHDAAEKWIKDSLIPALCPVDAQSDDVIASYPTILPVSWVCRQLREFKDVSKLGREVASYTGIPIKHKHAPANWGAQVFAEAILQRAIRAEQEE